MKQTTIIGTLLTFLMLLLILLAAVVFLGQGRQQLQNQNQQLQGEVEVLQGAMQTLNLNLSNTSLTLTVSANELATSQVNHAVAEQETIKLLQTIHAMPPLTNTATATPLLAPLAITNTPNSGMNSNQPSGTSTTPTP